MHSNPVTALKLHAIAKGNHSLPPAGPLRGGDYANLLSWCLAAPRAADAAATHPSVFDDLALADFRAWAGAMPIAERASAAGELALLTAAVAAAALGSARAALTRAAVLLRGHYASMLECPALTALELHDWLAPEQRVLYPNVLRAAGLRAPATMEIPPWAGTPMPGAAEVAAQLAHAAARPHGLERDWVRLFDSLLPTLTNATRVAETVDCPTTDDNIFFADGQSLGQVRRAWLAAWCTAHHANYYTELHEYNGAMYAAMLVWEREGSLRCGGVLAHPAHCAQCVAVNAERLSFISALPSGQIDVQGHFRAAIRARFPATWDSHPTIGLFHPAVAGTVHYSALRVSMHAPIRAVAHPNIRIPYPCEPAWCQATFVRGDQPSSGLYQLTVTTVSTSLNRPWLPWETQLIEANVGGVEWTVAALLLGLNSVPSGVRDFVVSSGWNTVPLSEWVAEFKVWLTALRRCPLVHGWARVLPSDWDHLTKVLACTARSLTEAPWDKEVRRRTRELPCHWGLAPDGRIDRAAWDRDLYAEARVTTGLMVASMLRTGQAESADDYWEQRYARTPSGSSSLRKLSREVAAVDPRLEMQVRPGKKATVEALPDDYLRRLIHSKPVIAARTGTKHEPEAKNRALYADDDNAFFVTAYASHAAEKNMDHEGMRARQSPAEVVEWLAQSALDLPHSLWLSTDYSDYNWEHEATALRTVDLAGAAAWAGAGLGSAAHRDKAIAALWAARAHFNKWFSVDNPEPELVRALSTLFSGSRDTARHNTQLHSVYSKLGVRYAKIFDSGVGLHALNMCGDDEDGRHYDWISAYSYTATLMMMGLTLNIVKQLAGDHEFLQRRITAGGLPSRPMFAMIAQFSSGNWYVDKHMWYGSITAAISNTLWDMVTRGMPLDLARRLAAESISAQMRVPRAGADGGWRHLEWWAYRHGAGEHPLWYGTAGPRLPAPTITADIAPPPAAPGRSSAAWTANKMRRLNLHSESVAAQYELACRVDGYASLYTRERARAHMDFAATKWPERLHPALVASGAPPPRMPDAEVWALIRSEPPGRRPVARQEVLSRLGLDDRLVTALGGWVAALGQLKPDILARYEEPLDPVDVPLPLRWLDPAITAWYSVTAYNTAQRGLSVLQRVQKHWPLTGPIQSEGAAHKVTLVMAPNAAGKSTWAASHAGNVDLDEVVQTYGLRDTLRAFGPGGLAAQPLALRAAVTDTLRQTGSLTFTTQADATLLVDMELIPPGQLRLVVVEPPSSVLRERMAARGWTAVEMDRRLRRWEAGRDAALATCRVRGIAVTRCSSFAPLGHDGWPAAVA